MGMHVLDGKQYQSLEEEYAAREYIILLLVSANSYMHANALRKALTKRGYDIALRDFSELLYDMCVVKGYFQTQQEDGTRIAYASSTAFFMPSHLMYKLNRIGFARRKQLCGEMASRHATQPKHCV